MPIKHLDQYLTERSKLQTLPLSVLSDSRLGIDASYFLHLITESQSTREPLLAATGGVPLSLARRLEDDLRVLERLRIKPVFVFPGLVPNKKQKAQPHFESQEASRDRREAWSKYESGEEEAATRLFSEKSCLVQWDLWRLVLKIFKHRSVEFVVAPYLSWTQLIYLNRHQKAYIHACFGPTDTLLYPGVDKLITNIDLRSESPSFTFVSKKAILGDLGLTEDQFLDTGILLGFDHSPPFPPTSHDGALKTTVDMVKYYKSGHAAVNAVADHPAVKTINYAEHYARTRSMIKYSLILTSEGTVQPLPLAITHAPHGPHHPTSGDIPSDLHEIFTNRLPDEIYFYLSRGLIGPQALVWLTSGQIVEYPPLDNGDTTEYKRFIKEVITDGATAPRAISLALITNGTNNFWANRRVTPIYWFESNNQNHQKAVQHNQPATTGIAERVSGWSVPYGLVEEELRRQNSSTIDFTLCLNATSSDKQAARTKRAPSGSPSLDRKDEIVANILWRFLELRGFLQANHTNSAYGRALLAAIKGSRLVDKFQDPLYLFLELVRAGVMHGNLWSHRAYSGGPSFGTDEEKQCSLLVMRVLSIVPLNCKPEQWSAPLSRELLVFNSFLKSLTRSLRTLLEVTSLNMLLKNEARRHRDDLLDIALSLPFQVDVNTGFGILAKVYMDALTHINGGQFVRDRDAEGVREAKEMALELREETFPGVKDPKTEVDRGFRFWDVVLVAIKSLHAEGEVAPEVYKQFERAQAWLQPMRP